MLAQRQRTEAALEKASAMRGQLAQQHAAAEAALDAAKEGEGGFLADRLLTGQGVGGKDEAHAKREHDTEMGRDKPVCFSCFHIIY